MTDDQIDEQTAIDDDTQPAGGVSPALVLLLITGLMGLLVAGAMLLSEGGRRTGPVVNSRSDIITAPQPGTRPVRDWQAEDFELPTLAGDTISLSDFAGRPVFLNFWRTDCEPCVRELPAFQAFLEEQGEDGAVVLAVNQGEDGEQIAEFLAEVGITEIPVLLDTRLEVSRYYPVPGLPTTYFIDREGMVQYTKIGEMELSEMYNYLDTLPRG
jgi:peroxiredoxin